jgi:hypothetical protein
MKRVFICSPFSVAHIQERDRKRVFKENIDAARDLCRRAVDEGHAPFAPHLFYTQFLNDASTSDRERGLACGVKWLEACDEMCVVN